MRRFLCCALLAGALAGCGANTAQPTAEPTAQTAAAVSLGGLSIAEAWARPVALGGAPAAATQPMTATQPMSGGLGGGMEMGSNSAAYMQISNAGAAERLIKAESPVAGTVELHTVEDQNGVMAMRPVPAIEIPAQGRAELKPGGFHVMLIDVKRELRAGDTFTVTLTFEQAGAVTVPVAVRNPASR